MKIKDTSSLFRLDENTLQSGCNSKLDSDFKHYPLQGHAKFLSIYSFTTRISATQAAPMINKPKVLTPSSFILTACACIVCS